MPRWVEEVEALEEEFRRYIRACESMASFWSSFQRCADDPLAYRIPRLGSQLSIDGTVSGYSVYTAQKAAMYRRMALDGRGLFERGSGSWPAATDSLVDHVRAQRPSLEIKWDEDVERPQKQKGRQRR